MVIAVTMKGKQITFTFILWICAGAIIFILSFTLGLFALYKKVTQSKIGYFVFPHTDDVGLKKPQNMTWNESIYLGHIIDIPKEFELPIINAEPYFLKGEIPEFHPCQQCVRRDASFLYDDFCYYFTPEVHTFEACFFICARFSKCYWFYAPQQKDDPIIRRNMKPNDQLWVGIFKRSPDSQWETLDNRTNSYVWDVHGSYCAYVTQDSTSPRSYFNCQSKKYCLCAGYSH